MTLSIPLAHARELARLRDHGARPDFVLIGAVALSHHVALERKTNDVDLALVVAPAELDAILTSLDWTRDASITHRWHGPDSFRADVLPATPELIRAGSVTFERDTRTMSLVGFDLALEHASEVVLPGLTSAVKVASLAAIVVLKIVAWLDRPHDRSRDLGDLATVFRDALGDDDDRRWDDQHPLGSSGLDFDDQSPFCVGLDVSAIVGDAHRERIEAFIEKLLDGSSANAAVMAREGAASVRGPIVASSAEGNDLRIAHHLPQHLVPEVRLELHPHRQVVGHLERPPRVEAQFAFHLRREVRLVVIVGVAQAVAEDVLEEVEDSGGEGTQRRRRAPPAVVRDRVVELGALDVRALGDLADGRGDGESLARERAHRVVLAADDVEVPEHEEMTIALRARALREHLGEGSISARTSESAPTRNETLGICKRSCGPSVQRRRRFARSTACRRGPGAAFRAVASSRRRPSGHRRLEGADLGADHVQPDHAVSVGVGVVVAEGQRE